MTRRILLAFLAGALFLPAYARWKRLRERRRWDKLRAYGQARMEALGLGSMTDDEVEAYVDRAIHEYRQEQREKERAG